MAVHQTKSSYIAQFLYNPLDPTESTLLLRVKSRTKTERNTIVTSVDLILAADTNFFTSNRNTLNQKHSSVSSPDLYIGKGYPGVLHQNSPNPLTFGVRFSPMSSMSLRAYLSTNNCPFITEVELVQSVIHPLTKSFDTFLSSFLF